jgi:hypothetical protein
MPGRARIATGRHSIPDGEMVRDARDRDRYRLQQE